jgi:hypothetical protein
MLLGAVGLLYVLLGAKVLVDRKKKAAFDSEETAALTGGASSSSVAPDQSKEMADSNADPDVVIVDYGLDKF